MHIKIAYAAVLSVTLVLMSGSWLAAHHGDAGRYNETPVTVTGTMVEIRLVNPHSIVVFDETEPSGKVVRWQAEMGGGQQLIKQFGWAKDFPKIGEKITLTGRRVKNGAPYMNMTEKANIVLTESGKEIYRTQNYGQPSAPPEK